MAGQSLRTCAEELKLPDEDRNGTDIYEAETNGIEPQHSEELKSSGLTYGSWELRRRSAFLVARTRLLVSQSRRRRDLDRSMHWDVSTRQALFASLRRKMRVSESKEAILQHDHDR